MSQRASLISISSEREARDLAQPIKFSPQPDPAYYSFARKIGAEDAANREADARFHQHFTTHPDQHAWPIKPADFEDSQPANANNKQDDFQPIPVTYCNTEDDDYEDKLFTHRPMEQHVQPAHSQSPFSSPDKMNHTRREIPENRLSNPVSQSYKIYANPFRPEEYDDSKRSSTRMPMSSRFESPLPTNRSQSYYKLPTHRGQTPEVLRPDRITPIANDNIKIYNGNPPLSQRASPARHFGQNDSERGSQPREFNTPFQDGRSYRTPFRSDRTPVSYSITPESKFSPGQNLRELSHRQQEHHNYPPASSRRSPPRDAGVSYTLNTGRPINPIIEEYRKKNFQGVPIYRAKYFNFEKKGSAEKIFSNRGSPERYNPRPSGAVTERQSYQRTPHQSPPKRNQQLDYNQHRGPSSTDRAPFDVLLTEISHKADEHDAHPNVTPFMYNQQPAAPNAERIYAIFRSHNLDFPYLIINREKKQEPQRPPEIYIEKKRKRKDEIDPFLKSLAQTYVVKGDDTTSRRKSRALLKFEEAVKLTENELKAEEEAENSGIVKPKKIENFKLAMPSENDRLSGSQYSQESFSPTKKASLSAIPDGRITQVQEVKSVLIDQNQNTSETPASAKIRSALRQSSSISNPGEKKKESMVRISVPEKKSDATPKEISKNAEARTAGFLQKLNDMQQRSQRRLTTLIAHSEASTPAHSLTKRGSDRTVTVSSDEDSDDSSI